MSEAETTILMTGAGAPGASGIIRALERDDKLEARLVGVDMDPDAYGFALVDETHTVPAGTDSDYVPEMLDIVETADVDVVLPLTTAELTPLAEHKAAFAERGATVMVSDPAALQIANDKGALYEFLEEGGFDTAPDHIQVDSKAEFIDAVEALGYPDTPVCFKPPVSSGMRGFRILDPGTDRFDRLMNQKPSAAVTTLEDILPVFPDGPDFPELVVMEYLPGEEYSVDVLATDEGVEITVPRSRESTRAGITFAGTILDDDALRSAAREIAETIGIEYNANLQFKRAEDGTPKLIEINPRVAGTIVMCVGAGANLPAAGVRHALGRSIPEFDVDWGTEMNRYWQEVFYGPDGETFTI